jgi:hypothetical protein
MADDIESGARGIIDRAVKFLDLCEEAQSANRAEAMDDIRFREGQQWPAEVINSRKLQDRPMLTINKTDAYCTRVENEQRQQRPRIKVDPVGSEATVKVAQIVQGLVRHIENNRGGGDLAYDTGYSQSITSGEGFLRVHADFVDEKSFEQELFLLPIENQFSVYFDPNSCMPDGSDGEECLVTDMVPKHTFRRMYPDADDGANFHPSGQGDNYANWVTKEQIRVAEYWRIERVPRQLVKLSTGKVMWRDEFEKHIEQVKGQVAEGTLPTIEEERKSWDRKLRYWKLTALDVLEKRELPGKWLPIVPVIGRSTIVDGKRKRKGLVRNAKDPAKMYNFWRTSMTESIALAPKAKWLLAAGQDEGFTNEWTQANISAYPVLHYNQLDADGKDAPPPTRIQPEPPPEGIMVAASAIGEDLSSVLGIIDPAMRVGGNVSGKALNAERQQSDTSTFNYFDNLTRSIAQIGRILLDLIPTYYGEPGRVVRILGDDGSSKQVTINQTNPSPGENTPGPVEQVINDVTVGEYMVVMDTGPGLNTKRQEAVTALMPLVAQNEKLMDIAGDLVFRNMDFPGADVIADRLAAQNPLANIDDTSEIPQSAQIKMKQMQTVIQQLQQQLQGAAQEIKMKTGIEKMRQDGETQREHMRGIVKAHDIEKRDETTKQDMVLRTTTQAHDAATRAHAELGKEELRGVIDLILQHLDHRHELEIVERAAEKAESETA